MRRAKDAILVACLFLVLLVIFSSCLQATPVGALVGAVAGTPILVHVFNRLAPPRRDTAGTADHAAPSQTTNRVALMRLDGPNRQS